MPAVFNGFVLAMVSSMHVKMFSNGSEKARMKNEVLGPDVTGSDCEPALDMALAEQSGK